MKWFALSVLMCVVAKCFAMSFDELQDFSNFLKEKSLLDQPLKKNPADDNDDDDPISDHAWEESGRFEGDLILNDRQRQLIVQDVAEGLSRNGLKDSTKRWPDNEVIYYIQKEHFTSDQVQAIMNGIDDLSRASCVKFRPYKKGDRDAVVVQGSRRGCFSQVGYQGGYQVLNLSGRHPVGRGCFRHGTVVHEFLHTLGFYHMQSSPDRDDYIDVVWENIVQPARHNFRKYNLFSVSDFGVGYDYDSVLHYSRKAFSSNGGDTLVPKQSGVSIGQRIGLSDKDTAKLNKMYCDTDSNNFEAEETGAHKPTIKKKKPKNKAFEGHGIGYHQGKTVVIKLPAAETYRLPDRPSYHMFDYFSKAPQAMSPTLIEGFGTGKKITYSYALPAEFRPYEHKVPVLYKSVPNTNLELKTIEKPDDKKELIKLNRQKKIDNSKSKETIEDLDEKLVKADDTKTGRQDFNEAFNKLGEVIKRKIHRDLYKPNTDYSEFYNPVKINPVTTKTDYYLSYVPSSKGVSDHLPEYSPEGVRSLKLARQFIDTLNAPKSGDSVIKKRDPLDHYKHEIKRDTETETDRQPHDDKSLGGFHLLFGKIYPQKKLEEIKSIYSLKPEYTSLKHLNEKQDYSKYYSPNEKIKRNPKMTNAQYTLFGEPVPITATWHQTDYDKHSSVGQINKGTNDQSSNEEEREESSEIIEPGSDSEKHGKLNDATRIQNDYERHSYVGESNKGFDQSNNEEDQEESSENIEPSSNSEKHDKLNGATRPQNDYDRHLPVGQSNKGSDKINNEEEQEENSENMGSNSVKHSKLDSDKDSSIYDVTENVKDQVETVTVRSHDSNSEKYNLEDQLTKILEGYTRFDDFDIASPYTFSESQRKDGPKDYESSEAEYK